MATRSNRGLCSVIARAAAAGALLVACAYLAFEAYILALAMPDLSRAGRLSPIVLSEDRQVLKAYLAEDEIWRLRTTPQDVPRAYLSMLVAYEDRRFFDHHGVDVLAILRASYLLARHGRIVSGASTLTMQTVRLLDRQAPGLLGKIRQAALAIKLERQLDKQAILSLYLTLAPFGGNIEGVRAASLHYFGTEPANMSVAQAALLVAIPQAPERRRPGVNAAAGREARNWVLQRMAARGVLSRDHVTEALREPLPSKRGAHAFLAHHLSDRLRGENPKQQVWHTQIDRVLQRRIEAMAAELTGRQPDLANVAVLVVRNRDMAVRAYVGGADYFDADRAGMLDLARAIRSPGSALKPIIYGFAFEDLIVHPHTIVTDDLVRFSGYTPENFDKKYRGELLVRDALVQSVNTVAVMLLDLVRTERFLARLKAAGINIELPEPQTPPGLAVALGGLGINLENLAKLFAGIANRGKVRALRLLADAPADPGVDLLSREAAWAVANILADMPPAKGRTALRSRDGQRRVAYKTGTSYGFKDAWSVGFDADHVVAVWVGRPDGIGRAGETGASSAVPIMQRIFELLPTPDRDVAADRPLNSVLARAGELPDRLKRYTPRESSAARTTLARPFEIRFPVTGSTIRLAREGDALAPLTIWATGGRPPFRWYIDGRSLTGQTNDNRITWTPAGRGQVEIAIVDADNVKASSTAWLE